MTVLTTGRMPVRLTSLIGRDAESAALAGAAGESRMLTLTGPGGVGKSRLALAAVAALAACGTEVAWVDLARLTDPRAVALTVAAGLGVPEVPDCPAGGAACAPFAEAVVAYLAACPQGQPVLVVLDNCEHLAEPVAGLAEYLLARCPALSVLATSRERLGVEGERCWPVSPLAEADAVRLFADRARLVAPRFEVSDANRAEVGAVCARLDGLPLAIELAAARMRILSLRQLAARLDDVFWVLAGGARSAPARHQALRATLDWSHALLGEAERVVFRRLAAFGGGFGLEAAERVAAFGEVGAGQVLDVLARLADKSLLVVEGERYHLLATVREYAAERLAEAGEEDQARRAHLAYDAACAEQAGRTGSPEPPGRSRLPGRTETADHAEQARSVPDNPDNALDRRGPDGAGRRTGASRDALISLAPGPALGPASVPTASPTASRTSSATPVLTVRAFGTAGVSLGETALTAADWGYAKPRELLYLLITSPALTREQIGAALWPELSSQRLGNALHTALRQLRRALGDSGWVVYSGGRYSFNRARPYACDVDEFESALAAASRARPARAALPDLQRAVAVYGGDFLAGAVTGEWALGRRDELRRRLESALLAVGRLQAAAGRLQAAASALRRVVELEPLNESAHRELMGCWAAQGETARAVRHYGELAALLAAHLGVAPAAETTALYHRLAGRRALAAA